MRVRRVAIAPAETPVISWISPALNPSRCSITICLSISGNSRIPSSKACCFSACINASTALVAPEGRSKGPSSAGSRVRRLRTRPALRMAMLCAMRYIQVPFARFAAERGQRSPNGGCDVLHQIFAVSRVGNVRRRQPPQRGLVSVKQFAKSTITRICLLSYPIRRVCFCDHPNR
jgi:hypothetical protein